MTKIINPVAGVLAMLTAKAPQNVGLVPKRSRVSPASGVVTIDGEKTKYTNPSAIASSPKGARTRTKFT